MYQDPEVDEEAMETMEHWRNVSTLQFRIMTQRVGFEFQVPMIELRRLTRGNNHTSKTNLCSVAHG